MEWIFENCSCWETARQKAVEIGWPLPFKEQYSVEAVFCGDVPLHGQVSCNNCGSVRTGTTQM
jgi:hypothetical protein